MKNIFPILWLLLTQSTANGQQYEWKPAPEASDSQAFLYKGKDLIGGFNHQAQKYYTWKSGGWIEGGSKPKDAPDPPLFGVASDKINGPQYKTKDGEVTREKAVELIEKGVPEDRHKLRLTVIGDDRSTMRVIQDYEKSIPQSIKDKIIPMSLPPDDWCLKDNVTGKPMFDTSGNPTIYLQSSDGKVLHKQNGYNGPGDFRAIRRAVPGYDDKKAPDLRNDLSNALDDPTNILILGGVALFLWRYFNEQSS